MQDAKCADLLLPDLTVLCFSAGCVEHTETISWQNAEDAASSALPSPLVAGGEFFVRLQSSTNASNHAAILASDWMQVYK